MPLYQLNLPRALDHLPHDVQVGGFLRRVMLVRELDLVRVVGGDTDPAVRHPVHPLGPEAFPRKKQHIDFTGLELLVGHVHQEHIPVSDLGFHGMSGGLHDAEVFLPPVVLFDPVDSKGMGFGDLDVISVVVTPSRRGLGLVSGNEGIFVGGKGFGFFFGFLFKFQAHLQMLHSLFVKQKKLLQK